jgi:hypothetical protein
MVGVYRLSWFFDFCGPSKVVDSGARQVGLGSAGHLLCETASGHSTQKDD